MGGGRLVLRGVIYLLLLVTFFLGLPSFHYATALMVALLVRHKNEPAALFAPVDSYILPGRGLHSGLLNRVRAKGFKR